MTTPAAASGITPELLWQWADAGWLRRLDAALAAWAAGHDPQAGDALLAAIALLSLMEGKGHTCLPLADEPGGSLRQRLPGLLRWPAEAAAALQTLQASLPATRAQWLDALQASRLVWHAGAALDFGQPFVLAGGAAGLRLYLRRYWHYERNIARNLLQRAQTPAAVQPESARQWLDALFPPPAQAVDPPFNWQKAACAIALRQRLVIITGGPGTGKTYTAARLLAAALAQENDPAQARIGLAAPTGKAAARLKESIQQALQQLPGQALAHAPLHNALQALPPARTLHALLGARPGTRQMRHDAGNPLPLDWLIVDEASMIHLEMMDALLQALPATARLVLLGDKDQLASVEAGSVLGDLCARAEQGNYTVETAQAIGQLTGQPMPSQYLAAGKSAPALAPNTVMLRESRRFSGAIGQWALAVNQSDQQAMRALLADAARQNAGAVRWHEGATLAELAHIALHGRPLQGDAGGDPVQSASYAALAHAIKAAPAWPQALLAPDSAEAAAWQQRHAQWVGAALDALDQFRILCATREGDWGVAGINALVIASLRQQGLAARNEGWFAGRAVQVTQNDASLGLFNGDVGICLPSAQDRNALRVFFPGAAEQESGDAGQAQNQGRFRSIAVTRMAHVETAFAMTVHKSQGSEFAHVLLALPAQAGALLSKELVYTGLTRAREAFTYLAPQPGIWQQAVRQQTLRASGLADVLQNLSATHPHA